MSSSITEFPTLLLIEVPRTGVTFWLALRIALGAVTFD